MKKLFTVILALCIGILGFSGCTGEVEQTNESLTVAYYGEDNGSTHDAFRKAANKFMNAYPNVKLILQREPRASDGGEAYFNQMATEVMSGRGPDLFWVEPIYMDAYKLMSAGAFADLAPLVDADPDFSEDAYNMAVLQGGRYKGAQYIVPLKYDIPVLISEKQLLEKAGFDYQNCTDFMSLWEELTEYTERHKADPSLPNLLFWSSNIGNFPCSTGIPWIDMENRKIDLSDERWPSIFASWKEIYFDATDTDIVGFSYAMPFSMMEGDFLFDAYQGIYAYDNCVISARGIGSMGEPCLVPICDVSGGLQAQITEAVGVRRNSPNRQNAYNFIKILLDPEIQASTSGFTPHGIPLSNEALKSSLEYNQIDLNDLGGKWLIGNGSEDVPDYAPLSPEFTAAFFEASQKVDGAYFMSDAHKQFRRAMEPYINGEMTYEEAIKEAEATLKIYISE